MMSPTSIALPQRRDRDQDKTATFTAMACTVSLRIAAAESATSTERVHALFQRVERECTRFDSASDLMRANAAADSWHRVGRYCFDAVAEAARAHRGTGGLFDPRVLASLKSLGYDRSLAFEQAPVALTESPGPLSPLGAPWTPGLVPELQMVRIGGEPIDLGGIGKGLAVRWAAEILGEYGRDFFVEAGGDGYFAGDGPSGGGWQVGVEDPTGRPDPVAVLSLRDQGCATSSTRLRRWTVGGTQVHHLIDPTTGAPGGGGLKSVTVVDRDAATAEVWSKVLFLHGAGGIAAAASANCIGALWIDDDGALHTSSTIDRFVVWVRP
jgi:thiamine biosynthesis lipoprotein